MYRNPLRLLVFLKDEISRAKLLFSKILPKHRGLEPTNILKWEDCL